VIKVIMTFPSIYTSKFLYVFALLTYNHMSVDILRISSALSVGILYILSSISNLFEQRLMKVYVYWFLIMQKYKISFWNVVLSIIAQCIWITSSRRIAKECSGSRLVIVQPRPKSVVVNFIYSNHV